ncbi:MAG TPA: hypothetical protein VI997_02240 [Candidatus Thermoplasmatota archaeon]|nr:hypothetical protein [Candidatus Thermoplasmatota archaeon]
MSSQDCCGGYGGRRFWTREEKAQWLKEYAEELEAELKAVRERLEEFRKA